MHYCLLQIQKIVMAVKGINYLSNLKTYVHLTKIWGLVLPYFIHLVVTLLKPNILN